jgi:hypothetical protein
VDSTAIYWTESGTAAKSGTVERLSKSGGTPVTLASNLSGPSNPISAPPSIYWGQGGGGALGTVCDGSILGIPASGGSAATIAGATGLRAPINMAVVAGILYWGGFQPPAPTCGASMGVFSVPVGGAPTATTLNSMVNPLSFTADGSGAYVGDFSGSILRVPLSGGAAVTLATGQSYPQSIATDPASIYWFVTGSSSIMRLAK